VGNSPEKFVDCRAKLMITDSRNHLKPDIIKASECYSAVRNELGYELHGAARDGNRDTGY
jgi:hypothetical protein